MAKYICITCEVIWDDFIVLINNIILGNTIINKCVSRYTLFIYQYNNICILFYIEYDYEVILDDLYCNVG